MVERTSPATSTAKARLTLFEFNVHLRSCVKPYLFFDRSQTIAIPTSTAPAPSHWEDRRNWPSPSPLTTENAIAVESSVREKSGIIQEKFRTAWPKLCSGIVCEIRRILSRHSAHATWNAVEGRCSL